MFVAFKLDFSDISADLLVLNALKWFLSFSSLIVLIHFMPSHTFLPRVGSVATEATIPMSMLTPSRLLYNSNTRFHRDKSNRKAMNMNWSNQKANPAL